MGRKGVHGLETHTVKTHRLLVTLRVILTSGVQDAHGLHHRIKRNTSSEVPHCHLLLAHPDLDLLAEACRELVDRVVHNLLQKHIDTVSRIITLSKSTDVHTRSEPDMLDTIKRLDVIVAVTYVIVDIFFFCRHIHSKT